MSAFVAFARTGDPNNSRMPHWTPFVKSTRVTMTINQECRPVEDYLGADRRAAAALHMDPLHRDALIRYRD
jgi:para-nitrobenzyl esterase